MAEQDETTLGNVLTPEEYQSRFIDFYAAPQIQVEAAPEVDEPENDDEPIRPDILTPVGQRGEQVANVFGQIPLYGTGEQFGTEDYNSYIENFDKQQASDLSGKSFNRYLEQAAGVPGAVATVATGLPISAMAYGAGQLARKEHRKNAAAIQAISGASGDMFKFNGQTVSRAPGSKIFTGNLGGLSQADMFRSREIAKGFVPGTMAIGKGFGSLDAARTGGDAPETGLSGVTSIEGAMMDAFGTVHTGQRNESGHMMASATQAQRLREQEFRDMASQANIDISGLKGADFVNAAVAFKQHVDGAMKTDPSYGGFFHKTSNLSQAANNSALDRRRGTAVDFLRDKYGITTVADTADQPDEVIVPDAATQAQTSPSSSDDGDAPTGGTQYSVTRDDPTYSSSAVDAQVYGGSDSGGGGSYSGNSYSVGGGGYSSQATGDRTSGRVGFADGGVAAQPAGFVGGPPENFTDGQTVADDQPMSVPEGTFVINAAAVEFAGSDDIKTMLSKAYGKMQKKVDKTIGVARIPTEDEIDVAVSRGEVIVPPEVAKIIGYDRLEKINNRGKKEVSRRQEAAGGGFLTEKKFANGGEVDLEYEDRIVTDEVRRKMRGLVESLPDDVKVESVYYQPGYPAAQRYQDEVARLNETEPFTGSFFSRSQKAVPGTNKRTRVKNPSINVPQTPTLFNLAILAEEVAHQDAIKHRQEYDPKKHKVDRRTFKKEQDYLEELRAKDFAMSVVGGLFPKADKTIRGTKASYEKDFARYLSLSDNPQLVETYLKKYPELNRFIERSSSPGENDVLLVSDDNYYGQGQPKISPDSSFLDAAMSEDITAMNEYHASFNYMLDKFKYLAAQLFVDAEKPEYKSGYTASLPK